MDIFISYSRHDKEIVFPFVKQIEQELNTTCWIDYEGIESGSQFEDVIVNAIEASKIVLFMLSDNSVNSQWTKREVLYAEDEGKRIVPIVIDGKGIRKWFRFHFGNIDYIDIKEEGQYEKLLKNMSTWIGVNRITTKGNPSKKHSQVTISEDMTTITLSIPGGFDLVLKKDVENGCYVGDIPVQDIAMLVRNKMDSLKGIADPMIGGVNTGSISILGLIGAMSCKIMGKSLCNKFSKHKEETFNAIVSELNRKYKIHLKKKNDNSSDYSVMMDASEMSRIEFNTTKQ